jgi:hypothetical protein
VRRTLLIAAVAVVVLSLGVVAFTQRSGPTPEDKALAARLMQEAVRDALLRPDPGERASELAKVVRTARKNADEGEPAVSDEEALNLLRKALEDAEALPADRQEEAISLVLTAVGEIDWDQAMEWSAEERKHGKPVPPEFAAPEEQVTDAAGDVDITANDDLPAAIKQAQEFGDPHQRMEAKLQLGSRLLAANLWAAQGKQLLVEAVLLAERMASEVGGQARLLRVAASVASHVPERALPLYQKAYDAAMATKDPEQRIRALADLKGYLPVYDFEAPAPGDGESAAQIAALRARTVEEAAQAALKLPAGNAERDDAVREALQQALEDRVGEGAAQFEAALRWARELPVENGSRSRALAQVADAARATERRLADDLVGEARDVLPSVDSNWDAVTARASTIAAAALAGDKRCWDWASQDAALIRRSELPTIEGEFRVPVEFKRAVAETMVLGATFASGDIQRARKFVQSQAQLGGYEAARALWAVLVYIWDPSMSLDLAEKLVADLQERKLPAGGCTAAVATVPAFAYKAFFPDAEVLERAAPLLDRALDLIAGSPQAMDRAFAAAGLAAVCASVDAARSARSVGIARDALGSIADEKTRDALAKPVCALIAVADPQTAAAMTGDVKDPGARLSARLAAAEAMRFDVGKIRGNWPMLFVPKSPMPTAPPPMDARK